MTSEVLKFHKLQMKHSLPAWMSEVGLKQWAEVFEVAFSLNGFIAGGFANQVMSVIDHESNPHDEQVFPLTGQPLTDLRRTSREILKDNLEFYLHTSWNRGDVDIFFDDEKSFDEFQNFLRKTPKIELRKSHKGGQLLDYYVPPMRGATDPLATIHNLQIISTKKSLIEILSTFDLSNAMVGFDASSTYVVDNWFNLSKTNTLDVFNWKSPVNTIQRMGKWHAKHRYNKLSKRTSTDLSGMVMELVQFVKESEVTLSNSDGYGGYFSTVRNQTVKIENDGEDVFVTSDDIVKWIMPYLPSMSNEQLLLLFTLIPPKGKSNYGPTPFEIIQSRMEKHEPVVDAVQLTFDPAERAREKQASRDADEKALADGTMTVEEIERKNSFLTADRVIIHWDKSRRL